MLLAQILIKDADEDYLSYTLNFMTFGNMNQKLGSNM